MRIAIPIHLGRISPLFDLARRALLVELDDDQEQWRDEISMDPPKGCRRGDLLERAEVDHVICASISAAEMLDLLDRGVLVWSMVAGDYKEIIDSLKARGEITDRFRMPGCGNRPPDLDSDHRRQSHIGHWGWKSPGGRFHRRLSDRLKPRRDHPAFREG